MSIARLFAEKSVVFSFEIFPPKRDSSIDTIWSTLEQLEGLGPDFISVTYGAGGDGGKSHTARIAGAIRSRYGNIEKEEIDMDAKMLYVEAYAKEHGHFSFRRLLEKQSGKMEIIVTFLIILELMKISKITIVQENIFDDIMITWTAS